MSAGPAEEVMAKEKGRWSAILNRQRGIGPVLGLLTAVLFAVLGRSQHDTSAWPALADAFLHGRDWLLNARPWEELAVRAQGGYWLPFPPFPAVFLMPFVAILGVDRVDTDWTAAVAAGLAVWQLYGLMRDIGLRTSVAMVLTISLGLGSEFAYVAATGGHHHLPMVLAFFGLTVALRLGLAGKWPVLAGLMLAIACASRPPVALSLPLFLYLYGRAWPNLWQARTWGRIVLRWTLFGLPLIIVAALVGRYNLSHFGSPTDFGYDLILTGQWQLDRCVAATCPYPAVSPWFDKGIESITYIPRSLYYMLIYPFRFEQIPDFPFIGTYFRLKPSWAGASLLLVMPSLLWVFRAPWRDRLVQVAGLTILLILLPDLAHGSWGFAQVGYRFILDALPIAALLIGLAVVRNGLSKTLIVAVIFGAAVTWYLTISSWVGFISY